MLPLLLLLPCSAAANFLSDPVCPRAAPLRPARCAGRLSTCWSPGVRDTDCPGHGLCCYDGCANTCVSERRPQPTVQEPVYRPPPPVVPPPQEYLPIPPPPAPAPVEYLPPPVVHLPPPPPVYEPPPPVYEPPPPVYGPPPPIYAPPPPVYAPPPPVYEPPPPVYEPPPPVVSHPPPLVALPSHPPPSLTCPATAPLSPANCAGRLSECWSVGVPDLDCPDWGICCFDGCANTCPGRAPPPPPPAPKYEPEPPPRNPCEPSPCHRTAMCIPQEGRAMCKCRRGLEGDRPEPHPLIQCSEPDPCIPSPCGTVYPGTTTCEANQDGNPICRCLPGLVPKPDTIVGCGPECIVDPDCPYGLVCLGEKCVERPDPCQPNPCGQGAVPLNQGDSCSCECPTGTVGDGYTGCNRGECLVDEDCSLVTACQQFYCVDPCASGTCRAADFCRVMVHRPICGFNEQPTPPPPEETFVIGERYRPPAAPAPDSPTVVGERYRPGTGPPARCEGAGACGAPPLAMMMMDTSGLPVIGIARSRSRSAVRRQRRQRVTTLV